MDPGCYSHMAAPAFVLPDSDLPSSQGVCCVCVHVHARDECWTVCQGFRVAWREKLAWPTCAGRRGRRLKLIATCM